MRSAKSRHLQERRVLQEPSGCNYPKELPRKSVLTTSSIVKKNSTRDVLKERNPHVKSILNMSEPNTTISSVEEVLKRSLKNAPRAAFPVRQTLTSKLRMEKANPLLTRAENAKLNAVLDGGEQSRRATIQPLSRVPLSAATPASLQTPMAMGPPPPRRPAMSEIRASLIRPPRPAVSAGTGPQPPPRPKSTSTDTRTSSAHHRPAPPAPAVSQTRRSALTEARGEGRGKAKNNVAAKENMRPSSSVLRSAHSNRTGTIKTSTAKVVASVPKAVQGPKIPSKGPSEVPAQALPAASSSTVKTPQRTVAKTTPGVLSRRSMSAPRSGMLRRVTMTQSASNVCTPSGPPSQPKSILRRRSKSTTDLNSDDCPGSSKVANKSMKSVAFHTPLQGFPSPYIANTPPPSVLRKRLEDWLKKRGKSMYSYNHLCCFGLSAKSLPKCSPSVTSGTSSESTNEAGGALDETVTLDSSSSTVILSPREGDEQVLPEVGTPPQPTGSSTPEAEETAEDSLTQPGALQDLKKLVHSGYPRDQCEHWLHLIAKAHPSVKDGFLYWECLAALEEARGDLGSAVDCLGRAIEQGADVASVDERLDALWERFSALGHGGDAQLTPSVPTRRRSSRLRDVDPKHIFKSTFIKFALNCKAVKRFNASTGANVPVVNYVVTPVRRSTRLSRSSFGAASALPTASSVHELTPLTRRSRSADPGADLAAAPASLSASCTPARAQEEEEAAVSFRPNPLLDPGY